MSLDPVLFASPMHETANEAVLFCQEFLERQGYAFFAEQLATATPVNDNVVAFIVRDMLRRMQPRVRGEAAEYVAIALSTLDRAFGPLPLPVQHVA